MKRVKFKKSSGAPQASHERSADGVRNMGCRRCPDFFLSPPKKADSASASGAPGAPNFFFFTAAEGGGPPNGRRRHPNGGAKGLFHEQTLLSFLMPCIC